ncbi:MAG: hypothetical protein ACRDJ9_33875 [Dehalococcoidia bacterium]
MRSPFAERGRVWPLVFRCRWCGVPVLRDNDGGWIHVTLAYVCRDRSGATWGMTAEPDAGR